MEANQNYLLNLLSNKNVTFYIPPYQRNYEWTEEECDVFFEDIQKTALKNLNDEQMEHFFSSFTYFESNHIYGQPSRLVLIDGQQRLTTTMLFLAAARDLITDVNKKNRINSYYLKNDAVEGEEEFKIKLKQVAEDSVIFKKIILQEPFSSDDKTSKVFKNYSFFKNKMSGFGDNKIFSFVEQGLNKFSIVTVQIDPSKPWENPQEIFESMNSMGKPLSFADLVRNFLLMGLDTTKQEEYYQKYWLYIEKRLPGYVSDFIRDYMQAKAFRWFKKATENNSKELYKQFREFSAARINNIEPLFRELCDYSDCYAAIVGLCEVGHPKIDKYLNFFRILKSTTIRSTILEILYNLHKGIITPIDTIDIIEPLFVHLIRKRCVGVLAGENKAYPELTKDISKILKKENKKEEMFKLLNSKEFTFRLVHDLEFKETILSMDIYHLDICIFILALIEQSLTKSMPDLKDKNLQIEHIMPQTLTPKWRAVLGENAESKHAKLVHTIGNLTLIRHNQELSNKSFDEKKIVYKNNSGLQIAKTKIIENDIWREEEIRRRGEYLVDYFLKNIAPIPDEINNASIKNTSSKRLNFREVGLIGEEIEYIPDPTKKFKIIGDSEVEYDGNAIKLSPLVAILKEAAGELNNSGKYSGYEWFSWEGFKLSELMRNENYENIVSKSKESRDSKITQKVDLPNIPENFNACLANDEYEVHVGQYLFSSLNGKGIVKSVVEEFSIFNVIFEESQAAVFNFPEAFENSKVIKIDKSRINK